MEEQKDLKTLKIDFDYLENYRDADNKDFPVHSFNDIYRLCGVFDFMKQYYADNNISLEDTSKKFIYAENIFVHPATVVAMRKLVQTNWKCYDLGIDRDNHVYWKASKYGTSKHYEKKLSNVASAAVDMDFLELCPGVDPEVPENTLVIRESAPKEVETTENEGRA